MANLVYELNDNGVRYFVTLICCNAIAIIATVLRFWCQNLTWKRGIHSYYADDWFLLATTIVYMGAAVSAYWGLFTGSHGMEVGEIQAELMTRPSLEKLHRMQNYLESLFIGVTILPFSYYLVKISICLFYRRIFSTPVFKRMCLIMMIVSTAWFIALFVANMVICIPVDIFWHRTKPGRCLNFNLFSLIIGIAEVFIDICILLLPVRAVTSLNMPVRTKIIVLGIFLLGGFAVVTNVLRIAYMYQPGGYYVALGRAEMWYNIHAAINIVCACLPVYKPLRERASKFIGSVRDRYFYASSGVPRFFSRGSRSGGGNTGGASGRSQKLNSPTDNDDGNSEHHHHGGTGSYYSMGHIRSLSSGSGGAGGFYSSYQAKQHSSTRELVLTPGGVAHNAGARRSDVSLDEGGVPVVVPPGNTITIARSTRVEVV